MNEQRTKVQPPQRVVGGNVIKPISRDASGFDLLETNTPVPHATDSGIQDGRVLSAVRKMPTYNAVSLDTAQSNLRARRNGEMAPIADGLDGPGEVDAAKLPGVHRQVDMVDQLSDNSQYVGGANQQVATSVEAPISASSEERISAAVVAALVSARVFNKSADATVDPFNPPPPSEEFRPQPLVPVHQVLQPAAIATPASQLPAAPRLQQVPVIPLEPLHGFEVKTAYLDKRSRISFTVEGGTYTVPVIDVKPAKVGLVVLMPLDSTGSTFVPALGTQLTIGFEDKEWVCFYPGIAVELDELGVQVLNFVFKEEQ